MTKIPGELLNYYDAKTKLCASLLKLNYDNCDMVRHVVDLCDDMYFAKHLEKFTIKQFPTVIVRCYITKREDMPDEVRYDVIGT